MSKILSIGYKILDDRSKEYAVRFLKGLYALFSTDVGVSEVIKKDGSALVTEECPEFVDFQVSFNNVVDLQELLFARSYNYVSELADFVDALSVCVNNVYTNYNILQFDKVPDDVMMTISLYSREYFCRDKYKAVFGVISPFVKGVFPEMLSEEFPDDYEVAYKYRLTKDLEKDFSTLMSDYDLYLICKCGRAVLELHEKQQQCIRSVSRQKI